MPKKIYDIKPPKLAHKKTALSEKQVISAPKEREKKQNVHHKKESHSMWPKILICALVIVVVIGICLFFKLPKADIVIWPKVSTLSFQQTITADKSANSVDIVNNIIPAQYFQATKTNAQDFPATGNADNVGQATGTITIYNKYDPATPFTFRAGTHFMSDSGKLFVALQKVVIPAAKKSGSKIVPGTVKVSVQAVEGGTDYNIAPANFSIPGLKGTPSYYSVTAVSTSAMSGGYSGKVKKVTDDDIQGAKDVLTQKTTADAMSALKAQISSDYVLLDNAVLSNVTSALTKTKSGAVADSFNYSVTVNASAVVIKKSDLDAYANNYLISKMPQGQTLLAADFKNSYSASKVDVSGGKATLNLDFSSGTYQNIDKNSMSLSLLGENADQIKGTIDSSLGDAVSKIQINFWPFWVNAVPNNQSRINIDLKFQ